MRRCRRGVHGWTVGAAVLWIVTASACGSKVHVATERGGSAATGANDPVSADLILSSDALELSINNRGETPVDVVWCKASLVDTAGQAFPVVRGGSASQEAAAGVSNDVSRIQPHVTLHEFVIPTRSITFDKAEGWIVTPLLPVECGPLRCVGYHELVGKTVELKLPMVVDGTERTFDWPLRITQAVRSSRGTRPSDPKLH